MGVAVVNSWDEKAGFRAGCYAEPANLTALFLETWERRIAPTPSMSMGVPLQ